MIIVATNKAWNIENFNLHVRDKYESKLITTKEDLSYENLTELQPTYIFFPHWSWIIPAEVYENFNCVIFHMTDLPFGRGGSPLQNLIVMGEKETKISALRATKELDAGDIYLKAELSLDGTAEEIYKRASEVIYKEMIPQIMTEHPKLKKQEGDVVTFKRRTPAQSNIAKLESLEQVYDYIRMLDAETYPHAFLETTHFKIEFKNASLKEDILSCNATISIKVDDE